MRVIAKTPPPAVPAYNVFGFRESIARVVNQGVVCPELKAVQFAPPSVLWNTSPPSLSVHGRTVPRIDHQGDPVLAVR